MRIFAEMAKGFNDGQMDRFMKDTGRTTKLLVRVPSSTQKETSMKENGSATKPMGLEHIPILTELSTRVIGKKTNNTATESRFGQTRLCTQETITKARRTERESSSSTTVVSIKENSK